MKMKENPDIWEQIFMYLSHYKEQCVFASLAGLVAILRGIYNGGGWKKTLLDGVLCAFFGFFAKDLLAFMGMNPDMSYISSVMIGYWGVERVSNIVKKKAGINND